MSDSGHLVESAPVPRNAPTDSQSPQAHRGGGQDNEKFSKGENLDGIRPINKSGGEANVGANKVKSDLSIESINSRAHEPRG
jgi:hypothetical protein